MEREVGFSVINCLFMLIYALKQVNLKNRLE